MSILSIKCARKTNNAAIKKCLELKIKLKILLNSVILSVFILKKYAPAIAGINAIKITQLKNLELKKNKLVIRPKNGLFP